MSMGNNLNCKNESRYLSSTRKSLFIADSSLSWLAIHSCGYFAHVQLQVDDHGLLHRLWFQPNFELLVDQVVSNGVWLNDGILDRKYGANNMAIF